MTLESISKAVSNLPGTQRSPFKYLWDEPRLTFGAKADKPDQVDEISAHVLVAALANGSNLCILLPDYEPRRPAFLLATALIALQPITTDEKINTQQIVLYCGSTVGIREQLKQTEVKGAGLDLAGAFRQQNVSRGEHTVRDAYRTISGGLALKIKKKALGWTLGVSKSGSRVALTKLPRVVTGYAPSDPAKLVDQYAPVLIAIDVDESYKAVWLQALLEEATRAKIPVVAWGLNPLSECVSVFEKYGSVFKWPLSKLSLKSTRFQAPGLLSTEWTQLQPFVVESPEVDRLADVLRKANQLLVSEAKRRSGRFATDALHQHWMYLRTLESLFVPYDFYEAEIGQIWGMKSFAQLRKGCERFKDYSYKVDPRLASELEKIGAACDEAAELIKENGSFLWNVLSSMCFEEPSTNEARLIVFSGRGKKQLFEFSLLAHHNITSPDLSSLRTWVLTLEELRHLTRQRYAMTSSEDLELSAIDSSLAWHPLLIGLPNKQLTPKLLPVLVNDSVDVLIYPHQISALKSRTNDWGKAISADSAKVFRVLEQLSKSPLSRTTINGSTRLRFNDPVDVNAKSLRKQMRTLSEPFWQPDDPVTEIAKLLQNDEEVTFEDGSILTETKDETYLDERESWCDRAITLFFDNGSITYAEDETINVIRPGQFKSDERYVGSVRSGDRIVFIHGQKRQNFYELIISRVHQHPSMILNLALIERWRTDFVNSYRKWQVRNTRNLDELLRCLNEKGSTLRAGGTLRQWLQGKTFCPDDPEDLRRLAEVLGMDYVCQHYKRIAHAAKRLRGLHVGLANKLNRWLEQQAAGKSATNDDDIIDETLGLTFGDLRSSLMVLAVRRVETVEGPLLRINLGRLEA
jgi:hypothetical protein